MVFDLQGNEIKEQSNLTNFENYGIYAELVKTGSINLCARDITNENLDTHFFNILNVYRDGIETPEIQKSVINFTFYDNVTVRFSVFYYFFNLILWKLPLECGDKLSSEFLFFPRDLTTDSIKKYIDDKFIERHQTQLSILKLNNIIDDAMYKFKYIDEFHTYLLNTINNEDTIDLMNSDETFNSLIHADLSDIPIENIKNTGMDYANQAISIIEESDHCLRDAFRTGQGINRRQWKEYTINIGTKPDGNGGIFPHSINSSFCTGGLQSKEDFEEDSGAARIAQIYSKENVGDAGHFSRILGLNNQSTKLHDDPNYVCNTKNFQKVEIKNEIILNMYKNRYYKFTETGILHKVGCSPLKTDKHLIGKTLYFRSPMTCASKARGDGICYKCYGDLAYVNYSISIGKIAAEILCSILTQMLLSSKHLLESMIIALKWVPEFYNFFDVSINLLTFKDDLCVDGYQLEISNIIFDNEYDQFDYNTHIDKFNVICPNGAKIPIHTELNDDIYLSNSLLEYLGSIQEAEEDTFIINCKDLKGVALFLVKLNNAEISRTLNRIISTIKTSSGMEGKDRNAALQSFIDIVIDGKVNIDAIHLETLLSNQIRLSPNDILDVPNWEYPNAEYYMIGLSKALTDHPSVTVSLEFEKQSKALYYPLNYKKTQANSTDLFFMTQPQNLMSVELKEDPNQVKKLFERIEKDEE